MGYPGDEGIVPRFCRELFARIEHVAAVQEDWEERAAEAGADGIEEAPPEEVAENLVIRVSCSMLEIYNGKVRDLFALKKKGGGGGKPDGGGLKVRDDPIKGPYAEGLTQKVVKSYASVDALPVEFYSRSIFTHWGLRQDPQRLRSDLSAFVAESRAQGNSFPLRALCDFLTGCSGA